MQCLLLPNSCRNYDIYSLRYSKCFCINKRDLRVHILCLRIKINSKTIVMCLPNGGT